MADRVSSGFPLTRSGLLSLPVLWWVQSKANLGITVDGNSIGIIFLDGVLQQSDVDCALVLKRL